MEYEPGLPIISLLSSKPQKMGAGFEKLSSTWPDLVVTTPSFLFKHTQHYREEMGHPLYRWWAFRDTLADPAKLVEWKHTCSSIEDDLSDKNENRSVNLDPGYLNFGLVVLGSFKYDLQKIYLGQKVYADPVLQYGEGQFKSFHWSFPDFKQPVYYRRLEKFRDHYKQLRKSQ